MIVLISEAIGIAREAFAEWRKTKNATLAARRAGEAMERAVGRALAQQVLKERRKNLP